MGGDVEDRGRPDSALTGRLVRTRDEHVCDKGTGRDGRGGTGGPPEGSQGKVPDRVSRDRPLLEEVKERVG